MSGNKKIKNATQVIQSGIKFDSKLETMVYNTLVSLNYNPQHEPTTYILWEGFRPTIPFYTMNRQKCTVLTNRKLVNITYTPDFYFEYKGLKVIVEAKGMMNDVFPYKFKMFRKLLESYPDKDDYVIFIVYSKKQLLESLKILDEYAESRINKYIAGSSTHKG